MSDTRSIGIFDSGLGGLTVVKEIIKTLPQESIVYIGDTARVPYGNRSKEAVIQFSLEITKNLVAKNVKAIVVACATASSLAIDAIKQQYPHLPIIGVIDSTALEAAQRTKNGAIGIIGTRATINSKSFEKHLKKTLPNATTISQSCPLFVPIIEEGIINDQPILKEVLRLYLDPLKTSTIDTLILGCTHYPLIAKHITKHLPGICLINPGKSTAHSLKKLLDDKKLTNQSDKKPHHKYFVTDYNENFETTAKLFLNQQIKIEKISL